MKRCTTLDEWMAVVRAMVNENLTEICEENRKTTPPLLCEAMEYSLLAGGKRIRPLLVYLAAEACRYGTSYEDEVFANASAAAMAVEMIHTYSLIHDDLPAMDDDDLRRGQPTNHIKFGEAAAILAGDALQALAFETLLQIKPEATAKRCVRFLCRGAGCHGMVGGQMDDIAMSKITARPLLAEIMYGPFYALPSQFVREEVEIWRKTMPDSAYLPLESMQDRKTGALIVAALMMGAAIADATTEQLFRIGMYGQSLGLMFQITDDLFDVCATPEQIGKATGKDAQKGKMTWVQTLGVDASRDYIRILQEHAKKEVEMSNFNNPGVLIDLLEFVANRDN